MEQSLPASPIAATPKRRLRRFSLRTLLVVMTVACCAMGFQVSWIRQRSVLLTEMNTVNDLSSNYLKGFDEATTLKPVGLNLWQQSVLFMLRQPETKEFAVFVKIDGTEEEIQAKADKLEADPLSFAKVRRARLAFPDAKICVIYAFPQELRNFSLHDVEKAISE